MIQAQLPVYWYSGLYLQPQHFQSMDLHQSWQHAQHWRHGKPWQSGIVKAQVNPHSLLDFTLEFHALEVVTAAGEYLAFPGNCHLQKRCFREAWKQRDRPFTIWGALRRLDPQQQNVTVLEQDREQPLTRWVTATPEQTMRDLYHQGPEVEVPRVLHSLRLLWDDEREEALSDQCFPLLRVRMRDHEVMVDETYAPPGIVLDSSEALRSKLEQIFFELTQRTQGLAELKHSLGRLTSDVSNESFVLTLVMRSLNRALPILQAYLDAPGVHPWQAHLLLVQLVGELSTFNDDCNHLGQWQQEASAALQYDHDRLFESFDQIQRVLHRLLNSIALEKNTYRTFEQDERGIYQSRLDRQMISQAKCLYMKLQSRAFIDNDAMVQGLDTAKLADPQRMESLIQHALSGVSLHRCQKTPMELPRREDTCYLEIDTRDPNWIAAEHVQKLSFFWAQAPDDLKVQLVYAGRIDAGR